MTERAFRVTKPLASVGFSHRITCFGFHKTSRTSALAMRRVKRTEYSVPTCARQYEGVAGLHICITFNSVLQLQRVAGKAEWSAGDMKQGFSTRGFIGFHPLLCCLPAPSSCLQEKAKMG